MGKVEARLNPEMWISYLFIGQLTNFLSKCEGPWEREVNEEIS